MRTIAVAAIALLLSTPCFAQAGMLGGGDKKKPGEKTKEETALERKQEEAEANAHKRALSRVPDRQEKIDPWGKIR